MKLLTPEVLITSYYEIKALLLNVRSSPEERPHGDSSIVQHGCDDFRQIQPDVRNINGHVISHLQNLPEPEGTEIHEFTEGEESPCAHVYC